MSHKFKFASHSEQDGNIHSPYTNFPQHWWRGFRRDAIPSETTGERTNPIPQDLLGGGFRSVTDVPICGLDNSDVSKEMQMTAVSLSDGKCRQEQQYPQHASSVMPQIVGEFVSPPTQMELVGHSIACGPYPYSDLYNAGLIPAKGPHSLGQSHFHGAQLTRMALPLEMAEEPVYVNAKQYHGILRRRQIRAKAELEKKVIKARKPYLHESRHLHAMRRARGSGGRFLNTKKLENAGANKAPDKGTSGSTVTVKSSSCDHIGSQIVPSYCSGSTNSSTIQQDAYRTTMHNMLRTPAYLVDNGNHNNLQHHGFQASAYSSFSDDHGGGESSEQQCEKVMINRSLHRAMAIK